MSQWRELAGRSFIQGQWRNGNGQASVRRSPVDARVTWQGNWSDNIQVEEAIQSACEAFEMWALTSIETRTAIARSFAEIISNEREEFAILIAIETGKPLWEARTEVGTVISKVSNSIDAIFQRRWTTTESSNDSHSVIRYRPFGTMLVLGPYNLPAHLPGAHIVPALLAGNTIVFKPSEWTPAVGQWLVKAWERAGVPTGVINLVHGNAEVAVAAAANDSIAGVLFTGSHRAGVSLHRLLAGKPERILALEMGGNNPLVVHNANDDSATAVAAILSAYITSGQRCTCARRLIVTGDKAFRSITERLRRLIPKIRVGMPLDHEQPFMGPMIHEQAADSMIEAQKQLVDKGAVILVEMQRDTQCRALLTPGLLSVEGVALDDAEHFGPMLLVQKANDLDEAIELANQTRFGLAAGFIGDREEHYQYFVNRVRAGVVNWNRQTTGASGRLPFGGIGASGNHRPSGFFAADYCSYPVASLESREILDSAKTVPGLEWFD
jgi:succinylglutamic semialdehyde dehydrogenase